MSGAVGRPCHVSARGELRTASLIVTARVQNAAFSPMQACRAPRRRVAVVHASTRSRSISPNRSEAGWRAPPQPGNEQTCHRRRPWSPGQHSVANSPARLGDISAGPERGRSVVDSGRLSRLPRSSESSIAIRRSSPSLRASCGTAAGRPSDAGVSTVGVSEDAASSVGSSTVPDFRDRDLRGRAEPPVPRPG